MKFNADAIKVLAINRYHDDPKKQVSKLDVIRFLGLAADACLKNRHLPKHWDGNTLSKKQLSTVEVYLADAFNNLLWQYGAILSSGLAQEAEKLVTDIDDKKFGDGVLEMKGQWEDSYEYDELEILSGALLTILLAVEYPANISMALVTLSMYSAATNMGIIRVCAAKHRHDMEASRDK